MTTTELKKIIADSRGKEWFINKTQGISFTYINFNTEIKGVSSMYEFSIQQINGWESLSSNLPEELHFSKDYFIAIKDSISQFVESYFDQENNTLDSY